MSSDDDDDVPAEQGKRRSRKTKLMIEGEKRQILKLIAEGKTNAEIRNTLRITDKMFRRRMISIGEDNLQHVFDSQTAEYRAIILNQCIEKMKWCEQQAEFIARNPMTRDYERLQALDRVRLYKIDQAKLLTEGPKIFRIISGNDNTGLYNGYQRENLRPGDTPALQEPARTNDERQF